MTLRLITPPASVSADAEFLARVRVHIAVDPGEQDALINGYVDAAVAQIDGGGGELGRALLTQTWALDLEAFPDEALALPVPPVQPDGDWTVDAVTYFDEAGIAQTLPPTAYVAPDGRGFLAAGADGFPVTASRPDAVTITVTSGSAAVADLPANIHAAILLMVGDLYANRETVKSGSTVVEVPMSTTVKALLARYRYWRA